MIAIFNFVAAADFELAPAVGLELPAPQAQAEQGDLADTARGQCGLRRLGAARLFLPVCCLYRAQRAIGPFKGEAGSGSVPLCQPRLNLACRSHHSLSSGILHFQSHLWTDQEAFANGS